MKIKKILHQHRRDFIAKMYCEFCGHEEIDNSGYDDRYYHDNVIPAMVCNSCKKSTKSEGRTPDNTITKYPEGFQV